MFRFLHAADLHLDSPLRGLESYPDAPVEQIRGATRRALENLVDLAIEEQVAFVLIAGDLYDVSWKDYNTGLFFTQCMARLDEAGIPVFVISGNHDAASVITRALRPPQNVRLFSTRHPETQRLETLGVAIHGQGYQVSDTRDDLAAAYPVAEPGLFNIGLLHTALTGRVGHESYAPTTLDVLKGKGYDYWALGHVHQREVVCESPWVVFPGNLQGRHIRETGTKGCTLVTVDEGRVTGVEHREIDVLRWQECRVDLSGCDSQDVLFRQVRQSLQTARDLADARPLAVRLILAGECSMHGWLHQDVPRWTQECRNLAIDLGDVWLEKVRIETRPEQNLEDLLAQDSPLSSLARAVQDLRLADETFARIPELAELQAKLPPELAGAEEPIALSCGDERARLQEDVRALLLGRLLRQGRDE